MTRQEAYQPIDHEKSAAESTPDRLRNMTETATDKLKEVSVGRTGDCRHSR